MKNISTILVYIFLQVLILNSCAVYVPENNYNLTQTSKNNLNNFNIQSLNNNVTLLPSDLTPLISSTQNLLSPAQDISDKSTEYNKILSQINNTQNQLNTLSSQPSTKARELKKQEIQAKLNNFIAQRDSLTQQINSSLSNLDSQKNNLRVSVNSTLGDNSSQDSNNKPANLQGYKDKIEDLESTFNDSVDSENTYGLVDSTNIISDESKLYADLVRDYTSSLLSNSIAETLTDDPDLKSIDKLTKPVQVIHYLNNRIKYQNIKLTQSQQKLNDNINNIKLELSGSISKAVVLIQQSDDLKTKRGFKIQNGIPNPGDDFDFSKLSGYELQLDNALKSNNAGMAFETDFIKEVKQASRNQISAIENDLRSGKYKNEPPNVKQEIRDKVIKLEDDIKGFEDKINESKDQIKTYKKLNNDIDVEQNKIRDNKAKYEDKCSDCNKNNKASILQDLMNKEQLPSSGDVSYVPSKKWKVGNPLPKGILNNNKGFLDNKGRVWIDRPSRTAG